MIRSSRQRETSLRRSKPAPRTVPVVLSIAGSDSSGGAGIQADLKTFTALGVYGTTAVTCVVAERPGQVLSLTPIPAIRVADQIRMVLEAFPVAAIKTGMLYSAEIIAAVEKAIAPALARGVPLVIDPVMVSSSGTVLLKTSGIHALRRLIGFADVVTPNLHEAEMLLGKRIGKEGVDEASIALAVQFRHPDFLIKGGHFKGDYAVDVLASPEGLLRHFRAKRIPGLDPHGTGCTYSAAIAAGLAKGLTLTEAVVMGKSFITQALRKRFEIGGHQMLNHFANRRFAG